MNEKLTVRNFGPIEKAEVEFKRVTVFIGPTGVGKSTLSKLSAIFRDTKLLFSEGEKNQQSVFDGLIDDYELANYFQNQTSIEWKRESENVRVEIVGSKVVFVQAEVPESPFGSLEALVELNTRDISDEDAETRESMIRILTNSYQAEKRRWLHLQFPQVLYVPAERIFLPRLDESKWSIASQDAESNVMPRTLIGFAVEFEKARKSFSRLDDTFFGISYQHRDGKDTIRLANGRRINLSDASSGMQATLPLIIVTLSILTTRSLSSIVEEPELNLYPDGQRMIINHLTRFCVSQQREQRDLTLTTHSPYILSHLNLLLYAHQVATQYPDRADEVAKLVPRESWIDPNEFAAYYVGEGSVRSIVSKETQLISTNELDDIAGTQADVFDLLIDISRGFPVE